MKLNRATKTVLLGGAAVPFIASTATAALASTAAALGRCPAKRR